MEQILASYKDLLVEIDTWFVSCQSHYPQHISCQTGCSGCCRGLFDITLLDAALLKQGFQFLPEATRTEILAKASARLREMQHLWSGFSAPYILNEREEEDWEVLMPDDDETPCVLLGDDGRCLVYAQRPMTCRLHGLPLVDCSGEIMHDEWCTENFTGVDPLVLDDLRGPFDLLFQREVLLGRQFTLDLLGEVVNELDTFIPLALLIDFKQFAWAEWWQQQRDRLIGAHVNPV